MHGRPGIEHVQFGEQVHGVDEIDDIMITYLIVQQTHLAYRTAVACKWCDIRL